VPELPEVETIRRQLDPELCGRTITRVRVYHDDLILGPDSRASFARKIRGREFRGVHRRAKYLLFPLRPDGGPERLMRVQLRMTGKFAVGHERPDRAEFRHPGVELRLDDGRTLYYDDTRRLGGFDLLTPAAWEAIERRVGPEPLPHDFTAARLAGRLAGSRAPIKNVLLDQRRVAGVGNIYASEALFRARIDPRRPAGSLDRAETARLHRSIRAVLREALTSAGTTLRDYRAVNGRSGSFQTRLRVYGRDESPCSRCGTPVTRIVQAGRSTFFCENCQF
jgi:formamidopyrimidine-DNA glycosylase